MMKQGLSRRDFLKRSSVLAAAGFLAACAPAGPEAGSSGAGSAATKSGQTVQYWFGWGGSYAGQTWDALQATEEFQEAIGDNTFEPTGSSGGETLLTAVAAGTPPDGASNVQYLDYMARGVLLPIDDLVAASDTINQDAYLEGNWNDAFYEGRMYGVPANESFLRYGLNYNTKLVEEAGLDPDSPPETWEECLEWHKALTTFDDAGNMQSIGLDPYDAMGGQIGIQDGFYPPVSWGWQWFDQEAGTFDLNNPSMVEAFEIMGEFYKIAGPDNMAGMRQVEGQGGWGGSFNAEVQAMIIEGYWHPGETIIEKPEVAEFNRATWAPVPNSRRGTKVQGFGGHYVILFQEAENTDLMFRVSEFLNTNTACGIIFDNVGWLPGLRSFLETVDPSTYPGLDFYFRSIEEADEFSSPARCPITAFVSTQYVQLRESHYRDEISAADAAAEFQKRCEDEYRAAGFA